MSSTYARRARALAVSVAHRVPSSIGSLADPPAGSGLKPIRGDFGPPLVGHSLEMLVDVLALARRRYARFGPVHWFGAPGTRAVMVLGPEAIGEVLTNRDRAFANKPGWDYFIGPFFKGGLMLMDFDEHRHHRLIMQQAFKRERLIGYLDVMNPAIARGLQGWRPDGDFRLYDHTKKLTLDLASEVFLGAQLGGEADAINKAFVDTVHGGQSAVRADLPGSAWHRGLRGRRLLESYFHARLPAKRADGGHDLFSVLCRAESDAGERFSDEEIVNHMIFLLMAAHDTSTITLSMMGYFLGLHRDWQERARAESVALGKAAIGYDDLEQLPSLDLVMKESLRMFAPVGIIVREALTDTSLVGHYVPAGTKLFLGIYPSQRMEPWWSDPDRFDPERFAEHRREDKSHQYAWAPFGGNVHKCIGMHFGGMEVKAILHQMLRRFEWTVSGDYQLPLDYGTGPTPADGLPIELSVSAKA
jgi:cytochrome P450